MNRIFKYTLYAIGAFFLLGFMSFFIFTGATNSWDMDDTDSAFTLFIIDPIPKSVEIHKVQGVTSMTGDHMTIEFSASEEDVRLIRNAIVKEEGSVHIKNLNFDVKSKRYTYFYSSP